MRRPSLASIGAGSAVALVAAVVLPIVGGWQIVRAREATLAEAERGARTLTHAIAQHASRTVLGVDLVLSDTVERLEGGFDRSGLQSFIVHGDAMLTQSHAIIVTDAQGRLTADTRSTEGPVNVADRPYFAWHRDHPDRELHVDPLVAGKADGRPVIPLSHRVVDRDGHFAGVVAAALTPGDFQRFYDGLDVGPHGTIGLWNEAGSMLVRRPALASATDGRTYTAAGVTAMFAAAPSGAATMVSTIDGVERIFSFEHVPDYPLIVTAGFATGDALALWKRDAEVEGLVLTLGTAALLVLAFGLGLRRRSALAAALASREADRRYRLLADNATDMITHMDLTGRRLFVSPASRDLLGYNPEDLVGTSPHEMIHPDDAPGLRALFADFAAGGRERGVNVNRLRHRDGRWIWIEASLKLLRDADGTPFGVVGAMRDITERRLADEALRRSEARYRLLADNSSDLIVLRSSAAGQRPYVANFAGPRPYVSPSVRAMTGYEPEEFEVLPAADYVHPDDGGRVAAEFDSLTADRPEVTSLHRVRHKDGHWLWMETDFRLIDAGGPGRTVLVHSRDVTARHVAELGLADSEARYRLLADRSSDMVSRLDLGGVCLYVSPASEEILGRPPEDLLGTRPIDFIHADEAVRVADLLARMGAGEIDQARSTHRILHARGHWIWGEVLSRLVREERTGEPVEIVTSLRDVSAAHALREEVEAGATLLRATLDGMAQGLLFASADRTVRVCNARAADMLGLDLDDPERGSSPDLSGPEHDWLFGLAAQFGERSFEHHVSDGSTFEVRRVPMSDGGVLLTLSDITHLKRAEMRVRETNRLLTMAEEVAHVGHWRIDLAQSRVMWSDEVYRIHGLDPAMGAPKLDAAIDFYHPDDRAEVERCVAEARAGRRPYEFNLRIVRPDGEIRHVLSRGLFQTDPRTGEPDGLFGTVMDVTDLSRAQRDLNETTAHLQATLDNMGQGLVKVAADGTIELSNRRFRELLGLPASLVEGPRPNFGEVVAYLADRGEPAGIGGALTPGTREHARPDGRVLEVTTVPLPGGSVVRTLADITSRRRAEQAVRDSEAQYRMLADSTSDVITRLDLGFERRYVSPACRMVFGYEPEEMLGARPSALIHPDDAAGARAFAERVVAGAFDGDRATTSYRFRHKEGHWIWIEAALNLVRDAETGQPTSIICSLRDISERQRAARHLERARATAEKAASLKAEFVANMSHELRTPLTGILGVHDLLQADPTLTPSQRRYVGLAHAAGRSLLTIVNDVLDFSKIDAGEMTIEAVRFDLQELVDGCRDLARDSADAKSLRLDVWIPEAPVTLVGDPTRLRQVILNLVTNAVKFTERGRVQVDALYDRAAARLRVEVRDTGIGIARDKLPSLFERFNQADTSTTRRYGGTGLGLAICKRLAELMQGCIGVESEPGRGSTFWFEVPLAEALRPATAAAAAPASVPRTGSRILLAEDNAINQEIISGMLGQRGHDVTVVDNGAAAAAAVRAGPRFAVVLMDLQMPVMDGLTATRAIRAAEAIDGAAATPIVGLTANAMAEDAALCLAAGMDAHVAKPVDWGHLFDVLDGLLGQGRERAGVTAAVAAVEVLDPARLEELSAVIGRDRVASMMVRFVDDMRSRIAVGLGGGEIELTQAVHVIASTSGQFGFRELSALCAEADVRLRTGAGFDRIDDLRAAVDRAAAAAVRSGFLASIPRDEGGPDGAASAVAR